MSYTIPSDTHVVGDSAHTTDHNNLADMVALLTAITLQLYQATPVTPLGNANNNTNAATLNAKLGGLMVYPAVVALTDAATITVNAALGNHFRVTLGGNRTLGNPSNPADGQKAVFEVIQDGTGSRTLAYGAAYLFGTAGVPTLTTTASKRDLLGFIYSGSESAWLFTGIMQGF